MGMKIAVSISVLILVTAVAYGDVYRADSEIRRLTYSGDHWVGYPSMSDDGAIVVFQEEMRDTSTVAGRTYAKRMIRAMRTDGSEGWVLFTDSTLHAPAPYEDSFLLVGTKPPLVSGNGRRVLFALSVTPPADVKDHYLGVVSIDGTGFQAIEFTNEALSSSDWHRAGFRSDTWERVANYGVSDDGATIACLLKGHLGPVASGYPSGVVILNADGSHRRALMAPRFEDGQWVWTGYPRSPLTGGGWAFALSGDGMKVLFGARSSEEKADYDLYTIGVDGTNLTQVTAFRDRLFSFAHMSDDGARIAFFYSGTKGGGIGTYAVNSDGTGLRRLTSGSVSRLDYDDVTDGGDRIMFKGPGGGFAMDIDEGLEILLFDRSTPGYVRSGVEMDFPSYPSFWAPNFVSRDGKRILLTGVPVGKDLAELYVLTVTDLKKTVLFCPVCGNRMEPSWKYCPYDGTHLELHRRGR